MIFVSILLPIYNAEATIERAISSILLQTHSNFELIIINDGSTDDSLNIINKYNDHRIKLVNRSINQGLVFSLNEGIELTNSNYIFRMDADDYSHCQRIEKQISFANKINYDFAIIGTNYNVYINNKFSFLAKHPHSKFYLPYFLAFDTYFCHPTVLLNKKYLIKNYNINYNCEDYDLFSNLIQLAPCYNLDINVFDYYSLDNGRSKIYNNEIKNDRINIGIKYCKSHYINFEFKDYNKILYSWDNCKTVSFKIFFKLCRLMYNIKRKQTKILNSNTIYINFHFYLMIFFLIRRFYINTNLVYKKTTS